MRASLFNRLHVLDGQIEGRGLKCGSGKASQNYVHNWNRVTDGVSWTCRLAAAAQFDVSIVYEKVLLIIIDGTKSWLAPEAPWQW